MPKFDKVETLFEAREKDHDALQAMREVERGARRASRERQERARKEKIVKDLRKALTRRQERTGRDEKRIERQERRAG